jgi:hypothetical protein
MKKSISIHLYRNVLRISTIEKPIPLWLDANGKGYFVILEMSFSVAAAIFEQSICGILSY